MELSLRTCGPALHDRLERPLEDATKWATVLRGHELVGGDALAKRCDQVDPVQQLPGRASLGGLGGSKGGPATVREGRPRGTGKRSRGANLAELVRAKQAQAGPRRRGRGGRRQRMVRQVGRRRRRREGRRRGTRGARGRRRGRRGRSGSGCSATRVAAAACATRRRRRRRGNGNAEKTAEERNARVGGWPVARGTAKARVCENGSERVAVAGGEAVGHVRRFGKLRKAVAVDEVLTWAREGRRRETRSRRRAARARRAGRRGSRGRGERSEGRDGWPRVSGAGGRKGRANGVARRGGEEPASGRPTRKSRGEARPAAGRGGTR